MARALELARAAPFTSPNPRVGAVVVAAGEVAGEGNHHGPGTPHAEALAIERAGDRARGATLYVGLEPCLHQGRTPPCAPAIVDSGVARVVTAIQDPDPRVAGKGLDFLAEHDIDVVTGVLEEEAREVNRAYLHQRATGRPLISLKLALSLDGRLAAADGTARWISSGQARDLVHRRRSSVDAVMVGAGSVIVDDPRLTARKPPPGHQPVRVVVDARGRVLPEAQVFGEGEVVVATTAACPHNVEVAWKEVGAEVVVLPEDDGMVDLGALVTAFGDRNWLEVMCEGGGQLATSLLRVDLVDRLELHFGAVLLGRGGPEIGDLDISTMDAVKRWSLRSVERLGDTAVLILDKERH